MTSFKKYLTKHPYLWHFNRESVSRGVAVGLFSGVVLFMPFQTLIAIFCCIILRANFPIAFLVSWICNPITIIPIAYVTSMIGNWVLGQKQTYTMIQSYSWNFANWHEFSSLAIQFGKGYFVGLPIVSLSLALAGYIVTYLIWNLGIRFHKKNI
jgi:hypothetical protein